MNVLEKRDSIYSHLHEINDKIINETFDKIYTKIESNNLTDELKNALDKGIESLDQGKSSSHEDVMARMRSKFPNLVK